MIDDILLPLLRIPSPEGEEQAVQEWISDYLQQLGYESKTDSIGNCFVSIRGEGEPLLLTAHMDTVGNGDERRPEVQDGVVVNTANTILGLDDKASIAIILSALVMLKEQGATHVPLEVLFTVGEEPGLLGAKNVFAENAFPITAQKGVLFDLPKAPGTILMAAGGIWQGQLTLSGISGHAARPENAVNVLDALSLVHAGFEELRQESQSCANISFVSVGAADSYNVVPGTATAEIELRSMDGLANLVERAEELFEDIQKQTGVILAITKRDHISQEYSQQASDPWLNDIEAVMQSIGLDPQREPFSFGSSDANVFQQHNMNIAVLGNGVKDTHSPDEHVEVAQLEKTRELLLALVQK